MELEQAMENRRSIRKYEAKPVETEKIRKMIQAAGLVPHPGKTLRSQDIM